MKKGTNFDISLTRTETLYLLKPDKYGKSITDFKFHEIKRQTTDFLLVTVGYTWSLNGHKKNCKEN